MRAESRALGQALLDYRRAQTTQFPPGKVVVHGKYTIRYSALCSMAGVPHLTRIVGGFLQEIAEWCSESGYPPLNSLAVNETGMPGEGYDGAGGFKVTNWPAQVVDCVRFDCYPTKMP